MLEICRYQTFVVRRYKTQNVLMSQHDSLIYFRFTKPGALFTTRENFHSHIFTSPTTSPHLTKAALANDLTQLNLASN